MLRWAGIVLLLAMAGCAAQTTGGVGLSQSAAVKTGFEAMEQPQWLPMLLPAGTQTKQFLSYDTSGGNADGLWDAWLRYVDQSGEWVIFDEIGPGCLYRQQINVWWGAGKMCKAAIDPNAHIKYYFDDEPAPRLDMTIDELFGKDQKHSPPFTPPLTFYDRFPLPYHVNRFANSFYPLPFGKRLKITIPPQQKDNCKWFQFTYLKYPPGTKVPTWPGKQADSPLVRKQWEDLGQDPKDPQGNVSLSADVQVPDGQSATAMEFKGEGSIAALRLTLEPYTQETLFKTDLMIYWDDQPTPAVNMPLGCFFGVGSPMFRASAANWRKTFASLFLGFDARSNSLYCYWPMPYWSKARVVVANHSGAAITVKVQADHKPASALRYPRGQAGHFHAKRTVDISRPEAYYSTAFEEAGRGRVVGIFFDSAGYAMDGDEMTYIDDSRSPQIHGDGTEDDHNQGWGGDAYQKPLWGGLVDGFRAAYRYYMNDSYVFDRSIRITYEHSDAGGGRSGQKTDVVVYYYKAAGDLCNLKLTDTLDVGDEASEKSHGYRVDGQTWAGKVGCCYDVYEQNRKHGFIEDAGRAFKGASEFTVRIDPRNQGVLLRRRCNRHQSNIQRADVYVDGRKADLPWYVCELRTPEATGWTDSSYFIPPDLTAGKKQITVKVQYADASNGEQGINEFCYWVHCYGPTPVAPASGPSR